MTKVREKFRFSFWVSLDLDMLFTYFMWPKRRKCYEKSSFFTRMAFRSTDNQIESKHIPFPFHSNEMCRRYDKWSKRFVEFDFIQIFSLLFFFSLHNSIYSLPFQWFRMDSVCGIQFFVWSNFDREIFETNEKTTNNHCKVHLFGVKMFSIVEYITYSWSFIVCRRVKNQLAEHSYRKTSPLGNIIVLKYTPSARTRNEDERWNGIIKCAFLKTLSTEWSLAHENNRVRIKMCP